MNTTTRLFALALIASAASPAQPTALRDSLLDRFEGPWVLQGTIDGKQTTHDVSVGWVIAHQYFQVHEISRERNQDGSPEYEAIVCIGRDPTAEGYACEWLDVTGGSGLSAQAIGHGTRSDDSIHFVFRGGDGSLFHTTFAYHRSANSWQWLMDGEQAGTRVPLARVMLSRP